MPKRGEVILGEEGTFRLLCNTAIRERGGEHLFSEGGGQSNMGRATPHSLEGEPLTHLPTMLNLA